MKRLFYISLIAAFILISGGRAFCEDADSKPQVSLPKDAQGLIQLLGSPDGSVVSQARFRLVSLGKDAVPALINALDTGKDTVELVYVLNSIKDESSAAPLAGLIISPDENVRKAASTALYSMGVKALPQLFIALEDPKRSAAAAGILSAMKDAGYFVRLRKLLASGDPVVKANAVQVEYAWHDPDAMKAMVGLVNDVNPDIRRASVEYIFDARETLPHDTINRLLMDVSPAVRLAVIAMVVKERDKGHLAELTALTLHDVDVQVRRNAAEAVYRCNPDNGCAVIIDAMSDVDETSAASAIDYAGELKCSGAQPKLIALLGGEKKLVQPIVAASARALTAIGGDYDPEVYLAQMDWDNLHVMKAVISAWEKSKRPLTPKIAEGLNNYVNMKVDNRFKDRAARLAEKVVR